MGALAHLWLLIHPHQPTHAPPSRPPCIDLIRDITGTEKLFQKPAAFK